MIPAFARELNATLAVCSQYILHGDVADHFLVGDGDTERHVPIRTLLWEHIAAPAGFSCLLTYDPVRGHGVYPPDAQDAARPLFARAEAHKEPGFPMLRALVEAVSYPDPDPKRRVRAMLLVEHASRLAVRPDDLERGEHDFFVAASICAREAEQVYLPDHDRPGPLFNPVVWLADDERAFPSWYTARNERVRAIAVPKPDLGDRRRHAARLIESLGGTADAKTVESFATQAEGLGLRAMTAAVMLARDQSRPADELPDAVRTYRLGVLDNPWEKEHLRERIRGAAERLHGEVFGQEAAVEHTLDILKRSVTGLSGAQTRSSATSPRGVLFFAGPTGVGKTQLAKAIARLVFGTESAYLRFDMSEFAAEHAGDRLIGAPPGYVGFEAGGELTNAMREQPFRVVLFDEIEKAHPRILDKFLQILDEGRLTDGRGNTAYFSESILVFTSNLGAADATRTTVDHPSVERRVKERIADYFVHELGRPELLNRFGDNIVVFGVITPETARRIFTAQLESILDRVRERHGVAIAFAPEALDRLRRLCTDDLRNGGRGIGFALETHLVNPLARVLFDERGPGERTVTAVRTGVVTEVDLA